MYTTALLLWVPEVRGLSFQACCDSFAGSSPRD